MNERRAEETRGRGEGVASAWAQPAAGVLEALGVDPAVGLSTRELGERRSRHGRNEIHQDPGRSVWSILVAQLKSVVVLLLVVAALLSFLLGDWIEGIAILVVIVANTLIGFGTELRAVRSMEALRRLGSVRVRVRRDGGEASVVSEELLPGDIVLLEAGDLVGADLRVLEAAKLQADESALTGESVPVSKGEQPVDAGAELYERSSMLHRGTLVVRGAGLGVVTSIGTATSVGRIAELAGAAEEPRTPLEIRLERLGQRLVWICLAIAGVAAAAGILSGHAPRLMIETGVALAVAAIPEGLPIVATLALARGMIRLARRRALLKTLAAVETLGSASVIFCDKTGTLTENRMRARLVVLDERELSPDGEIAPADEEKLRELLEVGALCSNATLPPPGANEAGKGDPLEVALLEAARSRGVERAALLAHWPETREEPFDPETKRMVTWHRASDGGIRLAMKGAPEEVIRVADAVLASDGPRELDDEARHRWLEASDELAARGYRVLALASRRTDSDAPETANRVMLVGLVGLIDPPRRDVREALAKCHGAGVRVVMVTGDHPATAAYVAEAVGLVRPGQEAAPVLGRDLRQVGGDGEDELVRRSLEASVFARTDPEQKLQLVQLHQDRGACVAMTGDGVNDAPALRKADIGIAMGVRGTEVAREAADMVLRDDAFESIVAALEQGRVIFDNIRKFVIYLLSCNLAEIFVIGLAVLLGLPLPLLPLQILVLNLVTDVFPALALGFGRGDPGVLERSPRDPRAPVIDATDMRRIALFALVIAGSVLATQALAIHLLELDARGAVTISFLTLAFAQLWHVFNVRAPETRLGDGDIARNPYVWSALGLCTGLLLVFVGTPLFQDVLDIEWPDARGWLLVLGGSLAPLAFGQCWLWSEEAQAGRDAPRPADRPPEQA